MSQELPGRGGSGFTKRKLLLILLIIGLGIIVVSVLEFLYRIAKSSLGGELAIVVVAGATIGILFMVLVGIGMGSAIELAICRRALVFKSKPMPGSWLDLFLKLWGSRVDFPMPEPVPSDEMPPGITMHDVEGLLLLIEQRKRGGKKSIHSDDVQFRTVRDWMILQSRGTSITLQQFLEERFGVAPHTGMPLVPNPTFYGWRKKFLSELEKYKKTQSGEK